MALTRHVNFADAINAQDAPAFHQIADAVTPVSAAQFLTLATSSSLANERVFTPGAGLIGTDGGAGTTYTIDIIAADGTITVNADSIQVGIIQTGNIAASAVTDAKLRNGAATSVIGRSANSIGVVADIVASADSQFLRRSGGVVGFGAITSGDLPALGLDATFLTLSTNAALANERVFIPGAGLTGTDGGAGGNYTLNVVAANSTITVNADSIQVGTLTGANISGFTSGSVIFAHTDGTQTQDNPAFTWDATNDRLELQHNTDLGGFRLGDPSGHSYTVHRVIATGILDFYGSQTGFIGYKFGGIDGDWFTLSSAGVAAIPNLAGGTSTLVKTSTTGVLSRGTGGSDYLLPSGWTAGSVFFANSSGVFTEDNANFFWDATNKRLDLFHSSDLGGLKLGTSANNYFVHRRIATGVLEFYGSQSGFNGYRFGGVDGDWMVISTTGTMTIGNLGGGSAALTMSSTAGLLQRVTLGTNLSFSGTTLNAATGGVPTSRTLTAGSGLTGGGDLTADRTFDVATADGTITINADSIQVGTIQTANIANDAVTFAKIQNISSNRILGRDASGGDVQELSLGTGLSLSGTTINATTYAPDGAQYLTLATNASLTNERVFTPGSGLAATDGGANGNYTVDNQVYTGKAGSPTWQGSSDSNNLTIKANTSSTGLLTAIANEFLVTISGTAIADSSDRYGFYVSPPSSPDVSNGVAASLWATCIIAQRSYACPSGSASVTNAVSLYISAAPSVASGSLTMTNKYALFVDSGLSRFDGDSSLTVFEVPDNNHTVSTTLASRCIPVQLTGGAIKYIRLYDDGA